MTIYAKMLGSLKWSSLTEIFSKLITPVTNMILARLLAPEEFGVLATVTMVISFTDILTDAGFQKYIIQHVFDDEESLDRSTNVAFWSNFVLSMLLWCVIVLFRNPIAAAVGSPGLGHVISIAGVSMPLTSLSTLQMARFRRDFRYKQLFGVRLGALLLPLVVTVPLAALGLGFWSLIIGTIAGNLFNVVCLTLLSSWRPRLYFDFGLLRQMFSYCFWTLMDSLAVWLTTWADAFVIGTYLSDHYLGLYKTSLNTVNGIFALISATVTSVLFVSLSKLQQDKKQMVQLFTSTQRMLAMLIIPMGVGIFLFRDLATGILLGSQWMEAAPIIGCWALASIFRICFVSLNSELYRASGHPKLPFLLQMLDLTILAPACLFGIRMGFWPFVMLRALLRLDLVIPNLIIMKKRYDVPLLSTYSKLLPSIAAALAMACAAVLLLQLVTGMVAQLACIAVCAGVYGAVLWLIPASRRDAERLISLAARRFRNKQHP